MVKKERHVLSLNTTHSSSTICPTATNIKVNLRSTVNIGRLEREGGRHEGERDGESVCVRERERERRGRERGIYIK